MAHQLWVDARSRKRRDEALPGHVAVPARCTGAGGPPGGSDSSALPAHALKEIKHFLQIYKDLEGILVHSLGWEGIESTHRVINESVVRYREAYPG